MHQNRFRLGLRPRPHWGSLRPPSRMGKGIPPPHTLPPSAPMAPRPLSRLRRSFRRLRRLDPSAPRSSRLRRSAASQRLKPTLLLPSGAATVYAMARVRLCLSVCICVCLSVTTSQVGVLLKRLNTGSHKQNHTIVQGLFLVPKTYTKFHGVNPSGAAKCRWGRRLKSATFEK